MAITSLQREEMHREGLAAYELYQRTGLHITEDEAEAWLIRLEAGEDADVPECHV
jgi:predicted transcriptional regulator